MSSPICAVQVPLVCVCVCCTWLQVIRDLSGPPNYWDMDRIENNMFRRYKRSDLDGSLYDSHSIMHYRWVGVEGGGREGGAIL